ncbi:MAG: EamA family transporter [Paenibacillaceae bacterium]
MKKWAYLSIVVGAALWGIIGLFVEGLYRHGFTPTQVVGIRIITANVILLIFVVIKNPSLLIIKPSDGKYFVGTGILSVVLFNWCYFTAIKETSLSIAAILLYTAPAFVMILSRIFFKEMFTKRKIIALGMTFLGCAFVIGIIPNESNSISLYALFVGLGSGFGYALYSIFGKFALKKYSHLTITTYTFLFASIAIVPASHLWDVVHLFHSGEVWLYGIGLGLFPTVLAFELYTIGLSYIESSRASITATLEPVVASLVGVLLFGEVLTIWQLGGIFFVLTSIILVQEQSKKREDRKCVDLQPGQLKS